MNYIPPKFISTRTCLVKYSIIKPITEYHSGWLVDVDTENKKAIVIKTDGETICHVPIEKFIFEKVRNGYNNDFVFNKLKINFPSNTYYHIENREMNKPRFLEAAVLCETKDKQKIWVYNIQNDMVKCIRPMSVTLVNVTGQWLDTTTKINNIEKVITHTDNDVELRTILLQTMEDKECPHVLCINDFGERIKVYEIRGKEAVYKKVGIYTPMTHLINLGRIKTVLNSDENDKNLKAELDEKIELYNLKPPSWVPPEVCLVIYNSVHAKETNKRFWPLGWMLAVDKEIPVYNIKSHTVKTLDVENFIIETISNNHNSLELKRILAYRQAKQQKLQK